MRWAGLRLLFAWCLLGCAGCQVQMPQSGFLDDYSRLQVVEPEAEMWDHVDPTGRSRGRYKAHIWFYRDDDVDIGTYDHVMVDDTEMLLSGQAKHVPSGEIIEFAQFIHDATVEVLEDRYTVVDGPAEGVLRFRAAVTRLEPAYYYATPDRDAHPLKRWANSLPGGATMEGEILDALSGRQICAVVIYGTGSAFDTMLDEDMWQDARRAVQGMLDLIRLRIDEAHDAAERPARESDS